VADLAKELEELHASVVRAVRDRIDRGGYDDDGNLKPTSNDDLRVALQLLKQNSITATLSENDTAKLRSQMASKLDFSALKQKGNVVPIVPPDGAASA
jgi:hypothetical protein